MTEGASWRRVEPTPAGAGRADPWTEEDAQRLRLLLELERLGRVEDPRREWRREEWRLARIVQTAFMPGDGSVGGDLL